MKREEIVRLMSDAAARQFIESVSPDASAEDKARWLDEGTMANIEGMEAALTAIEARGLAVVPVVEAARDVLAERAAHVTREGWTPEHDDRHSDFEMAKAASCYARHAAYPPEVRHRRHASMPTAWPWPVWWWKPKDPRRDLVRAAALIIAEIERLDRAAMLSASKDDPNV